MIQHDEYAQVARYKTNKNNWQKFPSLMKHYIPFTNIIVVKNTAINVTINIILY